MKETKHVRIIDSTFTTDDEYWQTKKMIGDIFEVKFINYLDKLFTVYTDKEKSDYWFFNFSDVQEVCIEAVVDGYVLGVGDLIDNGIDNKPILSFHVYDGNIKVDSGTRERTYTRSLSKIEYEDITPLYKPKVETIKIGEKLYNKSEVDKALANLKEIK